MPNYPRYDKQALIMKILCVASEAYPLIKTGGLADVVGALPKATSKYGVDMTILLPLYRQVKEKLGKAKGKLIHKYKSLFGFPARLVQHEIDGVNFIFLESDNYFDRAGGPYIDENGQDYFDNFIRFAALSKAAADLAGGISKKYQPDIIHAHDWQAALACVYLKYGNEKAQNTKSIITIHNIAFQGIYGRTIFDSLELPASAYNMNGIEYYGDINFLKGALHFADAITTVSPNYANEILTSEFGMGLEGVINERSNVLHGIVNGIDLDIWNPKTDKALIANYDANSLENRKKNKRELEKIFELEESDAPLFCVVSRLTHQKGMDILNDLFYDISKTMGARLAILGSGERNLENDIINNAKLYKNMVGIKIAYDENLSHLLQGGADSIIIPSRFEPCGLTQLYGLRYGCIPITSRFGGLNDTIIDANEAAIGQNVATGFQFNRLSHNELRFSIMRAVNTYKNKENWQNIQKNAMSCDFSWDKSAKHYADLYKSLV